MEINELTEVAIGARIEVHRHTGPGLLESAYQACVCRELILRGVPFVTQSQLSINYKGIDLDCGYRTDIILDGRVLLELKAVEKLLPIHEAQLKSYLKLGNWPVGLLINFNVLVLKQGIKRRILSEIAP